MQTNVRISRVRMIQHDKAGNPINIVVLDLANGKPSIVRNNAQFLQDLKNSFLITDDVMTIKHPEVREVLKDLRAGTVSGNITYVKKGDEFVYEETSGAITNPNHPKYGEVGIGDKGVSESDRTLVEGFLDISFSQAVALQRRQANAYASAILATQGAFDEFDVDDTNDEPTPHIHEDIMKEIANAGAGIPDEEDEDKQ